MGLNQNILIALLARQDDGGQKQVVVRKNKYNPEHPSGIKKKAQEAFEKAQEAVAQTMASGARLDPKDAKNLAKNARDSAVAGFFLTFCDESGVCQAEALAWLDKHMPGIHASNYARQAEWQTERNKSAAGRAASKINGTAVLKAQRDAGGDPLRGGAVGYFNHSSEAQRLPASQSETMPSTRRRDGRKKRRVIDFRAGPNARAAWIVAAKETAATKPASPPWPCARPLRDGRTLPSSPDALWLGVWNVCVCLCSAQASGAPRSRV